MGYLVGVYQTIEQGKNRDESDPFIVSSTSIHVTNATSKQFLLNWERVTDTDGTRVKNYVVEFSSQTHVFSIAVPDNSGLKNGIINTLVTGFKNNHNYNIAVRSIDSAGNSSISGIVPFTTPDVQRISPVSLLVNDVYDDEINLTILGGWGGVGTHVYTLTYKEIGVHTTFQPLRDISNEMTSYLPLDTDIELPENHQDRKIKVLGLKENTSYDFRIDVDDSDLDVLPVFGVLSKAVNTGYLALILDYNYSTTWYKFSFTEDSASNVYVLTSSNDLILNLPVKTFFSNYDEVLSPYDGFKLKVVFPYNSIPHFFEFNNFFDYINPILLKDSHTHNVKYWSSSSVADFTSNNVLTDLIISSPSKVLLGANKPNLSSIVSNRLTEIDIFHDEILFSHYRSYNKLKHIDYPYSSQDVVNLQGLTNLEVLVMKGTFFSNFESYNTLSRFSVSTKLLLNRELFDFNLCSQLINADIISCDYVVNLSNMPKLKVLRLHSNIYEYDLFPQEINNFYSNNLSLSEGFILDFISNLLSLPHVGYFEFLFYNNSYQKSDVLLNKIIQLESKGWRVKHISV